MRYLVLPFFILLFFAVYAVSLRFDANPGHEQRSDACLDIQILTFGFEKISEDMVPRLFSRHANESSEVSVYRKYPQAQYDCIYALARDMFSLKVEGARSSVKILPPGEKLTRWGLKISVKSGKEPSEAVLAWEFNGKRGQKVITDGLTLVFPVDGVDGAPARILAVRVTGNLPKSRAVASDRTL